MPYVPTPGSSNCAAALVYPPKNTNAILNHHAPAVAVELLFTLASYSRPNWHMIGETRQFHVLTAWLGISAPGFYRKQPSLNREEAGPLLLPYSFI